MAIILTEFLTSELWSKSSFNINGGCIIPTIQSCWYTAIIIVMFVEQPGAKISQVYCGLSETLAWNVTLLALLWFQLNKLCCVVIVFCVKTVVFLLYMTIIFMWLVSLFLWGPPLPHFTASCLHKLCLMLW